MEGEEDPLPFPPEAFAVEKPKLGLLLPVGPGKAVAVVGGVPTVDMQELVKEDPLSNIGPFRHRPTDTTAAQKGEERRTTGLTPKITLDSKLQEEAKKIKDHLKKHGMDSISYFKSPADKTKAVSCVAEYPLFPLSKMELLCKDRFTLYDGYDQRNDTEAVEFLLNSVDDSLKKHLESTSEGKPFGHYFANLVAKLQAGTDDRISKIKARLKTIKASEYSGEDIDALWADVQKLVNELLLCNAYDHSLTKELAMMLLAAGGTGDDKDQYRFVINKFIHKFTEVHENAVFLSDKDKTAAMKNAECMPADLFNAASKQYRFLYNTQRWAPAHNIAKIPGDLPGAVAPTANVVPAVHSDVQAVANALLQMMKQKANEGGGGAKTGACHNCGQTGHFKRDCPKLKKGGNGNGRSSSRRKQQQQQRQGSGNGNKGGRPNDAWKTTAPGPNDPKEKMVNDRKFMWCGKCGRWSTSHSTAMHIVKGAAAANMVPSFGNFAWHAPVGIEDLFGKAEPTSSPASDPRTSAPIHIGHELLCLLGWFSLGVGYTLGLLSAYINFAWWSSAALTGLDWLVKNYANVVPLTLWFGLMIAGVTLPWTLLPALSPTRNPIDPKPSANPSSESRRLRRWRNKIARRIQKRDKSRPCGATRLGFHRSFPLRCRNANLHLTMPHPRNRHDVSIFNNLARAVYRFATQFYPSADSREGDKGKHGKSKHGRNAKSAKGEWVWVQNERGEWIRQPRAAKPWSKNAAGDWVRYDRKDPAEHPIHKATAAPPEQQFFTEKAQANFRRLLDEALLNRPKCEDSDPPAHHPMAPPPTEIPEESVRPSDTEVYLTKEQSRAFDQIFGGPKYFAFIAQEDLSADVLKVITRIRKEYLSGKGLRPPTRKETQLPVIWDSGASVCVSFDRNDFVGPIQPMANPSRLRGFFRNGPRIRGVGHVAWSFEDTNGNLRTLKLPAMYVPEVKQRLLSTTCLLQTYPNEALTVLPEGMWLSGDGDKLGGIEVLTDAVTNLPTAYALSYAGDTPDNLDDPDGSSFAAPIPVASTVNANLSDAQRELVRWHQKLGHASYRRVQFLLRSGVLAHTDSLRRLHAAAAKLRPEGCPMCAACQFGKQRRRPTPGRATTVVRETAGALRRNDLLPGQRISVDHFICSTRGRLLTSRGKESEKEKYTGGCIFVDHASGFVHVELQVLITTAETLKAKQKFEQLCRDYGVVPHSYQADNGSVFTSGAFTQHLADVQQTIRYAGAGAHHHNGIAERAIQSIMSRARTMLLHAAIHWPDATNTQLWPFAVRQAVHLHNFVPDPSTGLSPNDLFTRTKHPSKRFFDLHPLFCPAYALDKAIADGHKLPRWTPRSERYIFVGFSDKHASTVPLLLNPRTGAIVTNYHVVFDDWFTTVSSDASRLPDFGTDEWERLFGDSAFQFVLDESDADLLALAEEDAAAADSHLARSTQIESAMRRAEPPSSLPPVGPLPGSNRPMVDVETPWVAPEERLQQREVLPEQQRERLLAQQREQPTVEPRQQREESDTTPISTPTDASTPPRPAPTVVRPASTVNRPTRLLIDTTQSAGPAPATANRTRILTPTPTVEPPLASPRNFAREKTAKPTQMAKTAKPTMAPPTRRSNRQIKAPEKLTYDVLGENARTDSGSANFLAFLAQAAPSIAADPELASAFKANNANPDLLSFEQAMACGPEERDRWVASAVEEIEKLESIDCWEEVPMSEATTKILPGTWAFRRKRTPDGEVKKWKGRYCVRGDLQEGDFETFAPVVAWATVRLFLVLSIMLEWKTVSVDFASAFVQAPLKDPIWIHLPRGFRSSRGSNTCLRLKRSLYGISIAPRLWYQHLFDALLHPDFGLTQSSIDPCLLISPTLLIVCFVDDVGLAAPTEEIIDAFIDKLRAKGFELDKEGSFEQFLGIKFERNHRDGTIELTQKGLISKIISVTGLESCKPNLTPASQLALGRDEDGEPMDETWGYSSVIGMLLYLSTNTRPDISFAVSQAARFSANPKKSHATAIKTIVRYLAGTADKGMILQPRGDLKLELFCDADFAGLYKREPDRSLDSARSRTGYIVKLSGCPLVWKSQLQTEVALSTLEAEYSALSLALRTLLPLLRMLKEVAAVVGIPPEAAATILAEAFEDNQGCLALATNHRLTSRTKYFHVKWHWFWYNYEVLKEFAISYIQSALQDADYLTKQIPKDAFQENRRRTQGW